MTPDHRQFHAAQVSAPSHGHVDCPVCGDRLYFGTDEIGRTVHHCYGCQVTSYLPLRRDPPAPRADRTLPKPARG